MNSKLAMFAGMTVVRKRIGGSGKGPSDSLVLVTKRRDSETVRTVRISIHPRAIRKLGWITGDYVQFHILASGAVVLTRASGESEGRKLCCQVGKSSSSANVRQYLRYAVIDELFDAIEPGAGRNVEISEGSLAFEI